MSQTGAQFLAYVIRKFKRTDKDTEIYEATTDTIADMRLQTNAEKYKEEAYIAGIATLGDYRIAQPSDFGHLIGDITVINTDDDEFKVELTKLSKQQYDDLYPYRLLTAASAQNRNTPLHYCMYGEQFFLGPVPDSTAYRYQINYTIENYTEVAAGTDPVPFTQRHRNVLRAGVLAELHDGLENFEESGYWRNIYIQGLGKMDVNDKNNINDRSNTSYSGF